MCQIAPIRRLPKLPSYDDKAVPVAPAPPPASSSAPRNDDSNNSGPLRVLICSESVPPQVNGIARRIGCYADGLKNLGCDVGRFFARDTYDAPVVFSICNTPHLIQLISTIPHQKRCAPSGFGLLSCPLLYQPVEFHCTNDDRTSVSDLQTPHRYSLRCGSRRHAGESIGHVDTCSFQDPTLHKGV